jgi:hypothetical protein
LDGGEGDENPMVTPQMPAGSLIRQAILHDEAYGQRNNTMGVMGFGQSIVGHVGVEVFATGSAVMLGVGDVNIPRTPQYEISNVVQNALPRSIPVARLAALRTRPMLEVATSGYDFRFGQIFRLGDSLCGVRKILSGTEHDAALFDKGFPAKKLPKPSGEVMPNSRQ